MFTKTLFGKTKDALALLGDSQLLNKAYLAGGSACALQLGHRISVDLDFFMPLEFDTKRLIKSLKDISNFKIEQEGRGTVLGNVEGVRFSIFAYKYPVLFPHKRLFKINILDLRDISAMKIDTIATRGKKRDFIDIYYICQKGLPLEKILSFYNRKFGKLSSNIIHIQKSLVYFVDAEIEQMPKMVKKITWDEVKRFFEKEALRLAKKAGI